MDSPLFNPAAFDAVHRQFVEGIQGHGPGPFNGFDDIRLREHELDYKHEVRGRATGLLKLGKWNDWVAGSPGLIFDAALAACAPDVSRNLMEVKKGDRGNSAAALFLTAKNEDSDARDALGVALHHFFCGGGTQPPEVRPRFESLTETVGSLGLPHNWPWYAYLAWLLSPDRYAPVRPRTFDVALKWFGSDQKMSRNITWAPYAEYTALIAWVRDRLRPLYGDVGLIGAHSFLFVAFYYGGSDSPFRHASVPPSTENEPLTEPNFEAELARRLAEAERREKIGMEGERAVFESERQRLSRAGEWTLAGRVQLVSAGRSDIGYDVLSFDTDGSERHIEVKSTASSRPVRDRFFLTSNERSVALRDPAWRVVRVWDVGGQSEVEDLGNVVTGNGPWELDPNDWVVTSKD